MNNLSLPVHVERVGLQVNDTMFQERIVIHAAAPFDEFSFRIEPDYHYLPTWPQILRRQLIDKQNE